MRLDLAARFGLYGTVGFLLIGLITFVLIGEIQSGVNAGTAEGTAAVLMILAGGVAVGTIYLFVLVGEYVDRELTAREPATIREKAPAGGADGD